MEAAQSETHPARHKQICSAEEVDFSVITQSYINVKIEPERVDLDCYADIDGLISLIKNNLDFFFNYVYCILYICAERGN